MINIIRILTVLFIFTIAWVEEFFGFRWFRIHIMLSLVIFGIVFLKSLGKGKFLMTSYRKEDSFIIWLFAGLLLSVIFNFTSHTINYLLAYFFVFIVELLFIKGVLYNYLNIRLILNTNTVGIVLMGIFVTIEFIMKYFFNTDIRDYLPLNLVGKSIYMAKYPRSYGLCVEPTYLSFYFVTLGPLAIMNLFRDVQMKKVLKYLFLIICLFAFITTFSAAGLIILPLSIILSTLIIYLQYSRKKVVVNTIQFAIVSIILFITILLINVEFDTIAYYTNPLKEKASLQQTEKFSRPEMWKRGMENLMKNPILGMGLGRYSEIEDESNVNWYLLLANEGGLVSLIPVLLYLFFTYARILKSKIKIVEKFVFLVGFISGVIYLFTVSTFFHPFVWLLISIFHKIDIEKSRNKNV